MKKLLIILFWLVSLIASGTNYYVSTSGSDSNDGLTPETPFLTLVKGRTMAVNPGDSLLLKRGDKWRSQVITIQASGTALAPIVIGAYGTGAKPIITVRDTISGSSKNSNWKLSTTANVWRFVGGTKIRRLWLNNTEYKECIDSTSLDSESRWYSVFTAPYYLYVWTDNADGPGDEYPPIEMSYSNTKYTYYTITATDKDYIHLSNLNIQGGAVGVLAVDCDGWLIDSCNIGYNVDTHGVRAYASAVGATSNNWIIKNCIFDTGLRLAVDFYEDLKEAEDGIKVGENCNNWEIHHNYFKDWRHTGISHFITSPNAYQTNNLKIHHNYFTAPDIVSGRGIGVGFKPGYGTGCEIYSNITYDTKEVEQITGNGVKYHHNIINGVRGHVGRPDVRTGALYISQYSGGQSINSEFYNNIIANCWSHGVQLDTYNTLAFTGNKFYNNIIFNNDTISGRQIYIADNAYITANEFKNNLIYKQFHTDSLIYFGKDEADDYYKTVSEFNAKNGTADFVIADNIGGDPLFVDAANDTLIIGAGSPAINAGIDVGLTTDFLGHLISSPPDIGAIQYQAPVPVPSGTVLLKSIRGKLLKYNNKFLK